MQEFWKFVKEIIVSPMKSFHKIKHITNNALLNELNDKIENMNMEDWLRPNLQTRFFTFSIFKLYDEIISCSIFTAIDSLLDNSNSGSCGGLNNT